MAYRDPGQSILVRSLTFIRRLLGLATLALIVVLMAPKAFVYFDHPKAGAVASQMFGARDWILKTTRPVLQRNLPTTVNGVDRADWVLIGIAVLVTMLSGSLANRARTAEARRILARSAQAWRQSQGIKPGTKLDRELDSALKLAQSGKASRQDLLKVFAETKKRLDSYGREVAFLAVDVVGSTQMKLNEDPAAIQYDFEEYRKMVERIFRARGVLKTAWTPDGVMACFSHVEDACAAGKDIIKSLKKFNAETKLTKADFAVRCGVNAGLVYFDDSTPLETISDRVIDIAGHMQKYAEPNSLLVARKVIEPLRSLEEFAHSSHLVDGYEASVWRDSA